MTIPPLRRGLDIFPSPSPDHPGIVMRDPYRYCDGMLVIPPAWVLALSYFDGEHTEFELQEMLMRKTGHAVPAEAIRQLIEALQSGGFLETDAFFELRERRHEEFRNAPVRSAVHTEGRYPREVLDGYFASGAADSRIITPPATPPTVGIAAPHVSPEGGWRSYADAYRRITPELADRVFVILGTSHYGQPEKFGLTRKPYVTPLGSAEVEVGMMDKLIKRAPSAVIEEDYCHSIEHSIEFQVLFLQYVMGERPIKVLPILCGPFADSLSTSRTPESPFFDALGELAAEHRKRLFYILGVDMAHMGARYGDDFVALADRDQMQQVAIRDHARLDRISAGDSAGFLDLVIPNGDDLKWCGYSPLYTFLRALPGTPGKVLRYEQWNIDPQSVVSFAGIEFG